MLVEQTMYLFRYLIFACLFSAVSAQATVLEQQAPIDGYQDTVDYSEFWIPSAESEGDQPDVLVSSTTSPTKRITYRSVAVSTGAICAASYLHFQSRAPPAHQ
ncbi:hypothetical protein CWE13_01280 [Aliidiomarina shirensis]|uniref:Uncharacterized protein n=1 Tax=Aliidiomarina shirensis TaxID=1048642 RepID=A0A432WX54_9GAMM|nr:hypothetical protein [Aliidiomarina shirensis]RUO38307.1 hypothetical protein CWE13_01280 [Aliidiomarina shirensis]